MNKQMKKNKKGFTLVEMIVVIAIIGVLAAMMVPSLLGYIDKANTSNNRAAATNVGRAAQGVLAEMNDGSIGGATGTVYSAQPDATAGKGIKFGGTSAFETELKKMYENEKFDGFFAVKVANGKLVSAHYKKTAAPSSTELNLSGSTKEVGVYPEG